MKDGSNKIVSIVVFISFVSQMFGCGLVGWVYRPYSSSFNEIERGMTESEVREVLGEPDQAVHWNGRTDYAWRYLERCRTHGTPCEQGVMNDVTKTFMMGILTLSLLWWVPTKLKNYYIEFNGYTERVSRTFVLYEE
jgi:hypothetical protein